MEEWRDIKNYDGIYQVSNLGRVKSLSRVILHKGKYPIKSKEKILKAGVTKNGYLTVSLCTYDKKKTMAIHKLVAMAFLNHTPDGTPFLVINHIDFDKLDNRVENLEIVTNRENSNKKHLPSTSQYVGVSWNKNTNKWRADIYINSKLNYLGLFTNEIEASNAYQNALKQILCQ